MKMPKWRQIKERVTDRTRLKQAGEEAFYTALAAFVIPLAAYLNGLKELPNLEGLEAVFRAGTIAVPVAFGKALLWLFTGSKVRKDETNV